MLPTDPPPGIVALPPGLTAADVAAGLLSPDVVEAAAGTFTVVPGADPGPGTGAVRTVRVEVEDGLAVDGPAFAATVMATLNDPRGWGADGSLSFARTDGDAELRVLLASPTTVDDLCAPLDTEGEVSCGTQRSRRPEPAPVGAGDAGVRRGQGRLPAVPGQPRGRAPARAPAREVPRRGPAGAADAAAELQGGTLHAEPLAVPVAVPAGARGSCVRVSVARDGIVA